MIYRYQTYIFSVHHQRIRQILCNLQVNFRLSGKEYRIVHKFLLYLFTGRLIGKHVIPQFHLAYLAHIGFTFADPQGALACGIPDGKSVSVWVARFCKVRQIIRHLTAEDVVLLFHRTPTAIKRSEPIPQVTGMPGTAIITGKTAIK